MQGHVSLQVESLLEFTLTNRTREVPLSRVRLHMLLQTVFSRAQLLTQLTLEYFQPVVRQLVNFEVAQRVEDLRTVVTSVPGSISFGEALIIVGVALQVLGEMTLQHEAFGANAAHVRSNSGVE